MTPAYCEQDQDQYDPFLETQENEKDANRESQNLAESNTGRGIGGNTSNSYLSKSILHNHRSFGFESKRSKVSDNNTFTKIGGSEQQHTNFSRIDFINSNRQTSPNFTSSHPFEEVWGVKVYRFGDL